MHYAHWFCCNIYLGLNCLCRILKQMHYCGESQEIFFLIKPQIIWGFQLWYYVIQLMYFLEKGFLYCLKLSCSLQIILQNCIYCFIYCTFFVYIFRTVSVSFAVLFFVWSRRTYFARIIVQIFYINFFRIFLYNFLYEFFESIILRFK